MAEVYELHVGLPIGEGRRGLQAVYSMIELTDAAGDKDEWHTDNESGASGVIGEGRGDWLRRASIRQIVLMNEDATAVEGTLDYANWPLRVGDMGKITLTKPMRGSANAGSKKDFSYLVWEVK